MRIAVRAIDGAIEIAVSDCGGGFPPEVAEALCRPFARDDSALSDRGTGLGLAIVRRIADAHGGTLHFERHQQQFHAILRLPAG